MICNTYQQFFSSITDETKFRMLRLLRKHPSSVTEICTALRLEQSQASHGLRKLKDTGFVLDKPEGKERIYAMRPETKKLFDMIDRHVDAYCRHHCKCQGKEKEQRWKP